MDLYSENCFQMLFAICLFVAALPESHSLKEYSTNQSKCRVSHKQCATSYVEMLYFLFVKHLGEIQHSSRNSLLSQFGRRQVWDRWREHIAQ